MSRKTTEKNMLPDCFSIDSFYYSVYDVNQFKTHFIVIYSIFINLLLIDLALELFKVQYSTVTLAFYSYHNTSH